jgi:predicted dehydrogenase
MARAHPGLPYGQTLRDLVRAGKLGTVTYVTASDRRRAGAAGGQLAEVGLQQLDELAQLFDGSASRIMARLVPERSARERLVDPGIQLNFPDHTFPVR